MRSLLTVSSCTAPVAVLALCAGALVAQSSTTTPDFKDLTKSGLPIKFYGFFRFDAYYDTARANNIILPATVLPENGTTAKTDDNEFIFDPRLTRFGFEIQPKEAIGGKKVLGRLETDFSNFPTGGTESRATPRIRLAYLDLATDDYTFRIGQDWDVISPLYPSVNGQLLQWNAGNLGDRRAQLQGRFEPKDGSMSLRASLGLTGAVSNEDLDPTPAAPGVSQKDGFDAGMPHLQMRAGFKNDLFVEKKPADLGVWGAIGRSEVDVPINGESRFDIWCLGVDWTLPLCDSVTFRGEAWTGQDLGDFRGCVGMTINRTLGEEISSTGGWGELVYSATKQTKFHLGGSVDDPDNGDLAGLTAPKRNLCGYAGTVVDWDCGLRTGFDVLYWETDWLGLGIGNMVRFDLSFIYNF